MGRETHKRPEAQLSDADRIRINEARAVLRNYAHEYDIDTAEPLTELGYEQRMARMKAADLSVALWSHTTEWSAQNVLTTSQYIYEFIWDGKPGEVEVDNG